MLLSVLMPPAEATRDSGEAWGYRMLDHHEPDGPTPGAAALLVEYDEAATTSQTSYELPVAFASKGCVATEITLYVSGFLGFDAGGCAWLSLWIDSGRAMHYVIGLGTDSRGAIATVVEFWVFGWDHGQITFHGVATFAQDGVVELHALQSLPGKYNFATNDHGTPLLRDGLTIDAEDGDQAVRWEPLGAIESTYQSNDHSVDGFAWPLTTPGLASPGVPSQEIGPFIIPEQDVGTQDRTVEWCAPSGFLCVGPYFVPAQGVQTPEQTVPGVTTPDVDEGEELVLVDLMLDLSDVHVAVSNEPRAPGFAVTVPLPGGPLPVSFCAERCPVALDPAVAITGSVRIHGTVAGEPVDQTVPL